MRGTLLIVDGPGDGQLLAEQLERDGFICLRVRGPLKLRTELENQRVDLIVWSEAPAHPELVQDLAREWERHPHIPVIHLFPKSAPVRQWPASHQIVQSLPAEGADQTLPALLDELFATLDQEPEPNPVRHTELAFRNILQSLRERRAPVQLSFDDLSPTRAEMPATSVGEAERHLLQDPPSDRTRAPESTNSWRRLFRRSRTGS